jgi:hypothetical protein
MQRRDQLGALLGALVLLTILLTVAARLLAPVTAGDALMRPSQPNFSSQAKTTFATAFEIDVPYTGSIENPWDMGSIWDEEAPAYDLRPSD